MTTLEPAIAVRYEGPGTGSELWGMSQANFLVDVAGRHSKEVAVLLNNAAADALATAMTTENTPEFRAGAARHAGEYLIRKLLASGRHVDSSLVLALSTLDDYPDILEHLKKVTS